MKERKNERERERERSWQLVGRCESPPLSPDTPSGLTTLFGAKALESHRALGTILFFRAVRINPPTAWFLHYAAARLHSAFHLAWPSRSSRFW